MMNLRWVSKSEYTLLGTKVNRMEKGRPEEQKKYGSSDKSVLRLMNCHDTQLEERDVSEPICLAFHGLDLVVHPFQWACGDAMSVVGEDAIAVSLKSSGESLQDADPRGLCLGDPFIQSLPCAFLSLFPPDLPEIFLQVVGNGRGLLTANASAKR